MRLTVAVKGPITQGQIPDCHGLMTSPMKDENIELTGRLNGGGETLSTSPVYTLRKEIKRGYKIQVSVGLFIPAQHQAGVGAAEAEELDSTWLTAAGRAVLGT